MQSRILTTRLAILAGASVIGLTATAPAFAQQIETVMVTAERRSENQQDVPISTSTLSDEQFNQIFASAQDIKAIASRVPGLYAESSNGRVAPRFYIRGLGNSDFDLAASQPVSIIMDDVVMENVVLKSSPVWDVQNVEVDRGPQGTLFGRNTTAGIVKFTSVKPSQEFSAYGTASYGELGTANLQAAVGGGLTDTLSARVSLLYQHRDDYITNQVASQPGSLGGFDERAGRIQLLWEPSSDFNALLNLHGRSLNGTAAVFRANIFTKGSNALNGNYIYDKTFFDQGALNPQKYDGLGGSLVMHYNVADMVLTSITGYETTHGYSRGDIDGGFGASFLPTMGPGFIPFPSDTQDGLDYLRQFTQEIHLASNYQDSPLSWQVGAFYFDAKYQDTTNPFFVPATSVRQSNSSWALFGQSSYKLTDDFTVTGGVRWTTDIKALTANGPLTAPIVTPVKTDGSNVSWDVSALYRLTDEVNLYARVATGFRAPSIQGRNLAFGGGYSIARSETITSYEAGVKTTLFNNSLRLNVDGFQYYVHNMQFSAIGGSSNSVNLINARGGNAYGMEADAQWAVTENLTLNAGASWTRTAIRDGSLSVPPCGAAAATPLASLGCTPLNAYNPVAGTVSINNNPFPQAPDYTLQLGATYTLPLDNGAQIVASTDWWFQGYTNFFLYKSREFHSNGNYEGGMRIAYVFPGAVHEVAVYGRNITDQQNVQGAIDFNNLTGFVGDPRVIGAEYRFHFN